MLDHIGIYVTDYMASKEFYKTVLAPLGYKVVAEVQGWVAIGDDKPRLWLMGGTKTTPAVQLAFQLNSKQQVDQCYQLAIANGGFSQAEPGKRLIYEQAYYGAFVEDLDQHIIKFICK
ncbi:VOC family protein [Spartinivicinus poritis]|uniref:VOC family protein n=1 Tax=Spartinivicinus poritis TaxID=2994640 RepID=A0ABT5UFL7_9GAMM|nr:VOC family protein [Spartinivicinus sp. A2-2]MDE1465143.1 VOC family protein [Spartinivicinus sp. A2-2]